MSGKNDSEGYFIRTHNGLIRVVKGPLALVDFYRSPIPPPAVAESSPRNDKASAMEKRIFKSSKR